MKKLFFAAIAALALTMTFTSCKEKVEKALESAAQEAGLVEMTPEEKAVAAMEDLLDFMKGIKIESAEDVEKCDEALEEFQKTLKEKYGEEYLSGDFSTLQFTPEQEEKIKELTTELTQEATRLAMEQGSVK